MSDSVAEGYAQDMGRTVNIQEAKANLSRLALDVEAGEEIIIARGGKPVMKLVPLEQADHEVIAPIKMNRKLGLGAKYDPNFDWEGWEALDEDVLRLFKDLS